MNLDLQITDMAGARPEHSAVIVNFVAAVRKQLKLAHFPDVKISFDERFEEVEL